MACRVPRSSELLLLRPEPFLRTVGPRYQGTSYGPGCQGATCVERSSRKPMGCRRQQRVYSTRGPFGTQRRAVWGRGCDGVGQWLAEKEEEYRVSQKQRPSRPWKTRAVTAEVKRGSCRASARHQSRRLGFSREAHRRGLGCDEWISQALQSSPR